MICSQCQKKPANVHFNGVINGKQVNLELCEDCARKSNLITPFAEFGLPGFGAPFQFPAAGATAFHELMDLLAGWHGKASTRAPSKPGCPICHWTMADFQKTGRMGCSECYLHFREEAANILKRIHGQTAHSGKKGPREVAKTKVKEQEKSLNRLRIELADAVKNEEFELAAELRDKIQALEKKSA